MKNIRIRKTDYNFGSSYENRYLISVIHVSSSLQSQIEKFCLLLENNKTFFCFYINVLHFTEDISIKFFVNTSFEHLTYHGIIRFIKTFTFTFFISTKLNIYVILTLFLYCELNYLSTLIIKI